MAEMDRILTDLTPKELKVLTLLSKDYDNARIAERLNCKVSTISQDLHRIYSKLQLDTNFEGRNKRVAAARIYLKANSQLSGCLATEQGESQFKPEQI